MMGGPFPWIAHASRAPSRPRQKRTSWSALCRVPRSGSRAGSFMALLILRTAVPSSTEGVVAIDGMARGPSLMNVTGFWFGAHAVELPSGSLCRVWSPAD